MNRPQAHVLPGDRLYLSHGPIDLVIGVEGARAAAFAAARARFATLLEEVVAELPALRAPLDGTAFAGPTARRMARAVAPHAGFVTPMAAVAGAVADEVLAAMRAAAPMRRAYVNNGGDIALHLGQGTRFRLAMAGLDGAALGAVTLAADDPVRGVATSGRGGRSLSMGIADSVTVLAENAAAADAAATLIANAVDLPGHPAIRRQPACEVQPDSDLGGRPVVTGLGALAPAEVAQALRRGAALAEKMRAWGGIDAAILYLNNQAQVVGNAMKEVTYA